jgi:preprotein translocase subunit SecE
MSAEKLGLDRQPDKRGLMSNIALIVVWAYVAMIYLLAFDQQFHWGIFSP